jgi:hypothetical protein
VLALFLVHTAIDGVRNVAFVDPTRPRPPKHFLVSDVTLRKAVKCHAFLVLPERP